MLISYSGILSKSNNFFKYIMPLNLPISKKSLIGFKLYSKVESLSTSFAKTSIMSEPIDKSKKIIFRITFLP